MTVGELILILQQADPALEITIRAEDERDGSAYCGPVTHAGEDAGCDDEPFFAIDGFIDDDEVRP